MCSLRACSVCECEEGEVPKTWLAAERGLTSGGSGGGGSGAGDAATCAGAKQPDCNTADCAIEMESQVDRSLEPGMRSRLRHLKGWRGFNNPWMAPPAAGDDGDDYQYINLLANPERYTGYKGEHAHRIWAAIYDAVDAARAAAGGRPEARVFYRLVSGMHASITTHLTADWLLDEDAGLWGPNLDEFDKRLGPAAPRSAERASNLYFAYLLVLRAVLKAGPLLAGLEYDTGLPAEDAQTRRLVTDLVRERERGSRGRGLRPLLRFACMEPPPSLLNQPVLIKYCRLNPSRTPLLKN
jgi:ERO1-like protein alpha